MTMTADELLKNASAMRDRILAGTAEGPLVQAWAAVARECAKADLRRQEELSNLPGYAPGFRPLDTIFERSLDRVWYWARAQVETRAREAKGTAA